MAVGLSEIGDASWLLCLRSSEQLDTLQRAVLGSGSDSNEVPRVKTFRDTLSSQGNGR